MAFWSRRKTPPPNAASPLRAQALSVGAQDLDLAPSKQHPTIFGLIMETGYPEAVATLAVFAEGSTSLYFSNGGGIIGAGDHDSVRGTHPAFFAAAESKIHEFSPASDTPQPAVGRVRFYVRTFGSTLTAEADEQDLGHMRHPLSELFHAGHAVIGAVRELREGEGAA